MKRFFVYLLTYLILFNPVVAYAWDGIAFSSRAGVDPTGLVIAINPLHSTVQDIRDRSRQDNDFHQLTAGNQFAFVSSMNASFPIWDADGSDFVQQEEIDDETGATAFAIITKDGEAAFLVTGIDVAALYGSSASALPYRVRLGDVTPDYAWVYIGEADAAEALNASIGPPNGTMEADANWANFTTPAVNIQDNTHVHGGVWARKFTINSDGDGILSDSFATVVGKLYKLTFWVYATGTTDIRAGIRKASDDSYLDHKVGSITTGSYQKVELYFTSREINVKVAIYAGEETSGDRWIDDVIFEEVTALGETAVHLYDDPAGSNRNLTGEAATFNPNGIVTMEVFKTIGDGNLTGSHSFMKIVKLDDGQPAGDEVLWSNTDYANDIFSLGVTVKTTGKLEATVSSDGATEEGEVTDAAAFTDGAMATFAVIGGVYDQTGPTYTFYKDGVALASSNLGGGAPGATVYDTYFPLTLGASAEGSAYLNGQDAGDLFWQRALTAAEMQQIYLRLLEEGLTSR